MGNLDRKTIEKRIQDLSREINKETSIQRDFNEPTPINIKKLDEMLYQWSLLADYYADVIYGRYQSTIPVSVDTEISVSILHNYVYWIDYLPRLSSEYNKKGLPEQAENFYENWLTLESEVQRILEANADVNDMPYDNS